MKALAFGFKVALYTIVLEDVVLVACGAHEPDHDVNDVNEVIADAKEVKQDASNETGAS